MRNAGVLFATHSLHFRVHTRVLLTLFVACAITLVLWAKSPTHELLHEAAAAQKAGQLDVAITKLEAARSLRPDYPRILVGLARAHASAGQTEAALAALDSVASLGLAFDAAHDPALASLSSAPAWSALLAKFSANAAPRGEPQLALTLPARDGIIESAIADSHGRWFFADVHNRCIWIRDADGTLREFSNARDGLFGVFSLALDERRGRLWAGVSALPEMKNFNAADKGAAFLAEYDLATGTLTRKVSLPSSGGDHVLGSLALGEDGSVFATDSASPMIWRLAPGATAAEAWLESDEFLSLQGLAFSADRRTLYVADYANGIWRIDVATKTPRLLRPPANATLFGIDDLRCTGRALVAVQNGVAPLRVLRIDLDEAGEPQAAVVLTAGHPQLDDLAGGWLHDGHYFVVGNAGWSLFPSPTARPAPRDVSIFTVNL
jgi:hypothetical protein